MGHLRLFFILLFIVTAIGFSQDSKQTIFQQQAAIQLNAFIDQNEIALNRTGAFKLVIEWYGDLDRFEIHSFDNPIVQNFEIVGSGSVNRVGVKDGRQAAVREYTYTLKPQAMGMGYIEGMIVTYTDLQTDTDFRLVSNRVPVEVIEPIPEPGEHGNLWLWGIIVLVAAAVAIYKVQEYIKKNAAAKQAEQEPQTIPLEEQYLGELKQLADFSQVNIDAAKILSDVAKLIRKFFAERYQTLDTKATTNEFISFLYENKFADLVVKDVKEVLSTADVVKFSGTRVERETAERAFTLAENILQKSQRNEIIQENDLNVSS